MNLIGEAPVTATQSVIERNQPFFLRIEVRETSSVRVYPKIPVYIFMDMEGRTGTFGITMFIREDEKTVSIGVQDQGIGIAENKKKSLFVRFENLVDKNLFNQASTGIGRSSFRRLAFCPRR